MMSEHKGVLHGLRVLELAAIGPVPWAAMLLADMGADVVRIERPDAAAVVAPSLRGRTAVRLDLKSSEDQLAARRLAANADVLLEGMRPGALERLGLGPEACWESNPRLVIGRMTGWGQNGPLAARAGHDINYIALTGALHAIGAAKPVPPLNLVGDYGGGAFLLIGVLAAAMAARESGRGRVVDAAMTDSAASMMTLVYERMMLGQWTDARGSNALDGGAPWYDTYETRDGKFMAVGCIEPAFYRIFLEKIGLDPAMVPDRADRAHWPSLRALFARKFLQKTRDEWTEVFEHTDACVTPVLSMQEAPHHPHNVARSTFIHYQGHPIPGRAPRCMGEESVTIAGDVQRVSEETVEERWRTRAAPTAGN